MARYTKKQRRQSNELLLITVVTLLALSGFVGAQFADTLLSSVFPIFAVILILGSGFLAYITYLWRKKELKHKQGLSLIEHIDNMSGIEFEGYVAALLQMQGYKTKDTPKSGDLGVDLIASKDGKRIAVQIKRYSYPVNRRAVSDAVAGMKHYKCDAAMVVTSNYFQPGAKLLAASNNCKLIDRDQLAIWIADFQKS